MNGENVPLKDAAFAEFISIGSRSLKLLPWLNRLIVGNNNVPEGWQHFPTRASHIEPWTTFDRDPAGTRLPIPRLYRMAGILVVQAEELDEMHAQNPGARNAVALRFGEAVVVGALAEGVDYAQNSSDDGQRYIAARIPGEDLTAVAGLWVPDEKRLVAAQSSAFAHRLPLDNVGMRIPVV